MGQVNRELLTSAQRFDALEHELSVQVNYLNGGERCIPIAGYGALTVGRVREYRERAGFRLSDVRAASDESSVG